MTIKRLKALKYLRTIIRKWGGTLEVVTAEKYKVIEKEDCHGIGLWNTSSVSGYAIHWLDKRIVIRDGCNDPGTIIHEMGHVFLDLDGPDNSDEYSWLGWEICLARKAHCYRSWSLQNSDYGVGCEWSEFSNDTSAIWGNLSKYNKTLLVKDRIEHAKRIGIVDRHNNPIPRR